MGSAAVHKRSISIPVDKLDFNFSRSSGPGGQNVNKVNTKAELRFNVHDASWYVVTSYSDQRNWHFVNRLPEDVRGRMLSLEANRINSAGELVITSQEQRSVLYAMVCVSVFSIYSCFMRQNTSQEQRNMHSKIKRNRSGSWGRAEGACAASRNWRERQTRPARHKRAKIDDQE